MKKFILSLFLLLIGCSTTQPIVKSIPPPCDVKVKGECHTLSDSEKAGAGSRGHTTEPKTEKMMFYVPPEEIWPEDFPAKPKVCASPFQGNQLLR